MTATSASFEQDHVHAVYESIAKDFSRTRHTCWPFVQTFLDELPVGSLVLDAGCGNGKYLACSTILPHKSFDPSFRQRELLPDAGRKGKFKAEQSDGKDGRIMSIGFDMSSGLLGIAGGNGYEVVRGDCFDMGSWRRGVFNHAISIATIHHFATSERRLESVKQLILAVLPLPPTASTSSSSTFSPQSTILIVVWALEQDPSLSGLGSARRGKKNVIPIHHSNSESRPTTTDPDEQDVFVPWELQVQPVKKVKVPYVRPPHAKIGRPTHSPPPPVVDSTTVSTAVPSIPIPISTSENVVAGVEKESFNRYYHLFKHYELSRLVESAAKELGASFTAQEELRKFMQESADEKIDVLVKMGGGLRIEGEWKVEVELKEETWERENWVVKIGVRWVER